MCLLDPPQEPKSRNGITESCAVFQHKDAQQNSISLPLHRLVTGRKLQERNKVLICFHFKIYKQPFLGAFLFLPEMFPQWLIHK